SASQWAGMMVGDESYAGSSSFERFEKAVQDITGMEFVVPTHQGRSAEYLLMKSMVSSGQTVIGNTHFDTTRANIENMGARALDLPDRAVKDSSKIEPFKGNIDLEGLKRELAERGKEVAMVILTVTNNSVGGQPVSMANIRATKDILK